MRGAVRVDFRSSIRSAVAPLRLIHPPYHTKHKTDKHLEAVNAVLAALRSPRLQSLLMIQASPAYLDRVVAGLLQKLEHMAKMRHARAAAQARRAAAIEELVRFELCAVAWLGWG